MKHVKSILEVVRNEDVNITWSKINYFDKFPPNLFCFPYWFHVDQNNNISICSLIEKEEVLQKRDHFIPCDKSTTHSGLQSTYSPFLNWLLFMTFIHTCGNPKCLKSHYIFSKNSLINSSAMNLSNPSLNSLLQTLVAHTDYYQPSNMEIYDKFLKIMILCNVFFYIEFNITVLNVDI